MHGGPKRRARPTLARSCFAASNEKTRTASALSAVRVRQMSFVVCRLSPLSARIAYDQLRWGQDEELRRNLFAEDEGMDHIHELTPLCPKIHPDGRQRRVHQTTKRTIVGSNNGHIFGHPPAALGEGTEQGEAILIPKAVDGGGMVRRVPSLKRCQCSGRRIIGDRQFS